MLTRTLVKMRVSQATFDEIAAEFRRAGYEHVFLRDGSIDMSEVGIEADPTRKRRAEPVDEVES